jgi:hypothetical protein
MVVKKRFGKRLSLTRSVLGSFSLCFGVALLSQLAGCATKTAPPISKEPIKVATAPPPVPVDAGLDKNEVVIDKPAALKPETVGLMARISPQQQNRIAQAVKDSSADPNVQALIVQAGPKIRGFVERLSCIRQYNDGGTAALQALAAPTVSFKFFVPPMHGTKNHNKSSCLTVASVVVKPAITQIKQGGSLTPNALQIKVSYVAEDSGETTTSNHEINKNTKGVWWFTR